MGDLDRQSYLRHRYGGSQRLVDWRERRLVAELLGLVGAPIGRALDAACGHGRLQAILRAAGAQTVVGVDLDLRHLRALAAAEAPAAAALARVDLLGRLPFADDAFDLTLCFRFLQHVRDPDRVGALLSELARVSRRHVVLSYYAAGSLHGLQRRLLRLRPGDRRQALGTLTPAHLARLATQAGLRPVAERALLAGIHAQRVALFERVPGASAPPRAGPDVRGRPAP